ncbi:helix-turn-helix domain-containing protein, partial [Candidatus Daviesbacteria bacterium]|nr:helix-turn-helix domain-containing protein [Candidatus Daviesbacteria bacterium]
MVRKNKEYLKALLLRKQGCSIKSIAREIGISSSTASQWCKGIELTPLQKENLRIQPAKILHLRSLAANRHLEKIKRDNAIFKQGQDEIKFLSYQEFFLTGVALY